MALFNLGALFGQDPGTHGSSLGSGLLFNAQPALSGGQVQGTSTSTTPTPTNYTPNYYGPYTWEIGKTGGTNTQASPPPPAGGEQPAAPAGPTMEELINQIYSPTVSYLSEAESKIRSQQPQIEQEIQSQYGTSKSTLEGEKASGERQIAQAETGAGTRKEDAASAARRLYQELVTGGRQRFGGATSAGQAYGELTANQLQRGLGDVQTQYSQAMMQIDNSRKDLELKFTSALAELENQKNSALNEARRYFDDKLLEISRLRGEAESAKAQARLNALQDLRNTVTAINMQDYQYKQQLAANYQTSQSTVETARQNLLQSVGAGQGAYQNLLSTTTLSPANALAMTSSRSAPATSYVGAIGSQKREDQYLA